jgi:hypothetical protein
MAGKDFDAFAQKHVASAAALGQVASGANNTKDKLKDLVAAYNETAKAYNVLTNDQKSSDFGKAMAESLVTLRDRIKETKTELYSVGDGAKGTGGIMDQLASKFTLNIDAMKLFNIGLQAAQGALSVVKDAFFASEANIDEWGRTVRSAETLWDAFLTSINTGDISGFLDRIDSISRAARDAYDALDMLSTQKAIDTPRLAQANTEVERLRAMLRTGRGIESTDQTISDGITNGIKLSKEQLSDIQGRLDKELGKVNSIIRAQIDSSTKAIDALYNEQAQVLGMSKQAFLDGTKDINALKDRLEGYKKYQAFENEHTNTYSFSTQFGMLSSTKRDNAVNPYEQYKAWGVFKDDGKLFQEIISQIQQRSGLQSQLTSSLANSYRQMNRADGFNPYGGGGGGRTVPKPEEIIPAGSVADLTKQMSELRKEQNLVTDTESWKAYETEIKRVQMEIDILRGKVKLDASGMNGVSITEGISKKISSEREKIDRQATNMAGGIDFTELDKQIEDTVLKNRAEEQVKQAKKVQESWKNAATAVGMFGNVLGSLKDPAAQIGATVAQAIASVALAYADTLAKDKTTKSNIWAFIAASAAAMVSMGTTIAQIHSSTGYASGGVVGGSHYSGDMEYARLNAGETVLTQAQTGIVASALQSGTSDLHLETDVRGDTLRLILRRGNMKRGYGSRSLVL